MNYCNAMREKTRNDQLIILRPSVAILNQNGEILLNRYIDGIWNIPGDILQLNESVEECIKRNALQDIGLTLNRLTLLALFPEFQTIDQSYLDY